MTNNKKWTIFFAIVITASIAVIAYYAESHIQDLGQMAAERRNFDAQNMAEDVSSLLNNTKNILQGSAYLPQVYNVPYSNSIDKSIHGIPQDSDMAKREIAQEIFKQDDAIETVAFLLPNGDVYIIEPYTQQLHVTSSNFAFRDYYKNPISTHQPYLSGVFKSQASGHYVSVISVPVFSENGTLTGIWLAAMNLDQIGAKLNSNYYNETGSIVILDNAGTIAAQSQVGAFTNAQLASLEIYNETLDGKSGSTVTDIGDTKTSVSYLPIKTFSGTWALFVLKPYDTTDIASATARELEIISISSLVILSVIFALFVRRL